MGPVVARNWLACLALLFASCSLVADFPDHPPSVEDDGGVSEVDARVRDAQPDRAVGDTGSQQCSGNSECGSDGLCCSGQGGGMQCVEANAQHCSSCTAGCDGANAPNCGARICECVPGSGKVCENGEVCDNSGAMPHCVECAGDGDCKDPSKPYCDDSQCVECKRGADLEASADDVGCGEVTKPICAANHTCTGCNDSKPATRCPAPQTCSAAGSCTGCNDAVQTIGQNGCAQESAPICKSAGGQTNCVPCEGNSECKFAQGNGYCSMGRCSNICDGDSPRGANNGCTATGKPLCKPASSTPGGFDCAACVASDCTASSARYCATAGAKAGQCVACLTDANCSTTQVCDQTSFTCRARQMSDCAAPTPYLVNGRCVACTGDAQCGTGHCLAGACVQCTASDQCPLAAPTCNPLTLTCIAACSDAICASSHPTAPKCDAATMACVCLADTDCGAENPLCEGKVCKACDTLTSTTTNPDTSCFNKTAGTSCIRTGTYKGRCGACGATTGLTCPGMQTCTSALTCM